MSHVLITIQADAQRLDIAAPLHLTATDLLGWIEETMGPSGGVERRSLVMPDGSALDDGTCLASAGVSDGMTLRAETPRTTPAPSATNPRHVRAPDLPVPLSFTERLLVTTRALLGVIRPTGVQGARARAVSAWQWTDHGRRLAWLIGRPSTARTPIISVSGHRSAEIAEQLALAFTSTRPEPVVLVDGDPAGKLSRHLDGPDLSWKTLAQSLSDPTFGRLQRDRLFACSPAGLPMIPAAEESAEHLETVLHALSRHRAIVIVDEGASPGGAPAADHAVISTIGAAITPPGAILARWGMQASATQQDVASQVPMDGMAYRILELAAVVAGRWAMSEPRSDHGELG